MGTCCSVQPDKNNFYTPDRYNNFSEDTGEITMFAPKLLFTERADSQSSPFELSPVTNRMAFTTSNNSSPENIKAHKRDSFRL